MGDHLNQSKGKRLQTTRLKIQHTYNILQPKKHQHTNKPTIPDYVRYEKELNSDDDMIIYGNIEEEKGKSPIETNSQFVLNNFNSSENTILFKFLLPFLDTEDAISWLQCCNKYSNIFTAKNELLYFWKFIYQRKWGKLKMMTTRKSKIPKAKQAEEFKNNIQDYKYWQQVSEYRLGKQWTIQYDHEYGKLTFWKTRLCIAQIVLSHR